MLEKLAQHSIPVIPNTSKTFAELQLIRKQTKLTSPFIVENGAAIFIPKAFFPNAPEECEEHSEYWVKSFVQTRSYWLQVLADKAAAYQSCYQGFSDMSDDELSLATGLSLQDAHLANTRLYSEPLHWLGSEEQKAAFKIKLKSAGANVLQGGRFVHISGKSNKGIAMNWLIKEYNRQQPNTHFQSIALGDSYNDNDMLEASDIAVQIKSPKHDFPTLFRTDNVWQSQHTGPTGWTECLQQILKLN